VNRGGAGDREREVSYPQPEKCKWTKSAVLWCSGQASRPLEPLTEVRILPGLSGFLRLETPERLFVMLTPLIFGESAPIDWSVGKPQLASIPHRWIYISPPLNLLGKRSLRGVK
jgi:hypothetical protein